MSSVASTPVSDLQRELRKSERKLAERTAENKELRKRNAELAAALTTLRREFTVFREEVKRIIGHVAKSKQLADEGQLCLFDDDVPDELPEESASDSTDDEDVGDDERDRPKRKKRARKTDKSLLPREVIRLELPEDQRVCPETGVLLVPIGEEITEELDYIAAELRVIERHRIIYGAPPEVAVERQIEPLKAPMPPQPLEGCLVSAALLVQLLVQKYVFHLPLYRQEEFFQQAGLFIPRSTLCDWVMKAAFALGPIARAIEGSIRAGPVLQLDDTLVKCQINKSASKSEKGIRQAYLWSFVNPAVKGVAFRFTEGRAARDLAPLLAGSCASVLLGDAYAGNKAAAREAGLKILSTQDAGPTSCESSRMRGRRPPRWSVCSVLTCECSTTSRTMRRSGSSTRLPVPSCAKRRPGP
jgi:transposase